MTTFVRGSTVTFSAPCLDASGAPIAPVSATLGLAFVAIDGTRTKTITAMTIADNVVSVDWDSSVAAQGVVRWNIKAVGTATIETEGSIFLVANEANS